MMRHAITLASIFGLLLLSAQCIRAQDITFSDKSVQQLARVIAEAAKRTNHLPSSYVLPMANGHNMIITCPNAFELFCHAIITWKATTHFPTTIPLLLYDLTFPTPDPQDEPDRDGESLPIFSRDIGNTQTGASFWMQMAGEPGHHMFNYQKFSTNKVAAYRLTIGQIVVAMAILIDESVKDYEATHSDIIPLAIEVPLVYSPVDWNDRSTPIPILPDTQQEVEAPVLIQPYLNISIQGIQLSDIKPIQNELTAPFCGNIRIDVDGYGPIVKIRLLLDGVEKQVFDGLGPHSYDLNTLMLKDGTYALSAVATDTSGKPYIYIYSFTVANGRKCDFTPAELDTHAVELHNIAG